MQYDYYYIYIVLLFLVIVSPPPPSLSRNGHIGHSKLATQHPLKQAIRESAWGRRTRYLKVPTPCNTPRSLLARERERDGIHCCKNATVPVQEKGTGRNRRSHGLAPKTSGRIEDSLGRPSAGVSRCDPAIRWHFSSPVLAFQRKRSFGWQRHGQGRSGKLHA